MTVGLKASNSQHFVVPVCSTYQSYRKSLFLGGVFRQIARLVESQGDMANIDRPLGVQ